MKLLAGFEIGNLTRARTDALYGAMARPGRRRQGFAGAANHACIGPDIHWRVPTRMRGPNQICGTINKSHF